MKKVAFGLVGFVAVGTVAFAQLGGLGGFGKKGAADNAGGDIGTQVDQFNAEATLIREVVLNASRQVVVALGTKEQIAKIKTEIESESKVTDPKELGSRQGTSMKDTTAAAAELTNQKDSEEKIKNMKPELQKAVAQSFLSIGIAGLKAPGLISRGNGIVQSATGNPMNVTKVLPVKDGLKMLGDAAPKLPGLASAGLKLMGTVKVNPGSPTADAQLQKPSGKIDFPEG